MSESFDRRLTPARPDLAAKYLEGRVEAARFVEGVVMQVKEGVVDVKREPRPDAGLDTQTLYGELVTVYDEEEGWAWGQLARDKYVGWIAANTLWSKLYAPTHRVSAPRTFVYPRPGIKDPPLVALPLGAELAIVDWRDDFAVTSEGGFVFAKHLASLDAPAGGFRRGRRDADRRALSLGRAQFDGDRLFRPRAKRAAARRRQRPARHRSATGRARPSRSKRGRRWSAAI